MSLKSEENRSARSFANEKQEFRLSWHGGKSVRELLLRVRPRANAAATAVLAYAKSRSAGQLAWQAWLQRLFSKRLSIAGRITAIALTLAVPLNIVIVAVIWQLSETASDTQRMSLLYTARSVAAALDAKLDEYMALAQTLARSPALLDDSLAVFETEARRAFPSPSEAWAVVASPDGRQLINLAGPAHKELPIRDDLGLAAQKRAIETRGTVIADLRLCPVSGQWIISIEVPVQKDGQPFRVLSIGVTAGAFFSLLNGQHVPKGWLSAIIDGEGRYVARVPDNEASLGQLSSAGSRSLKGKEGVFELRSFDGEAIVSAHARSAVSPWTAAVAVKAGEIQAAAWNASRWAMMLGGSFSVLSLLLAAAMARTITGPINKLRREVSHSCGGSPYELPEAGPPEISDLRLALKQTMADCDRSERALRESDEKLRLALDAAQLGVWRWDARNPDTGMQWDSRCRTLFGVSADTLVTYEVWADSIVPEDRARIEANVARALDPNDPDDETFCEYRVRHADGRELQLCSTGRVFFEPDPGARGARRVTFMAGAVRDVTQFRRAEAALRESEERLRLSNAAAGIGTFTIDLEGGCAHYSQELAAMLGLPAVRTAKIEDAQACVHPDDLDKLRATFGASLLGAGPTQIKTDFRILRPNGEIRWMTWAGRVDFRKASHGARPFRIAGACVDVTDLKRAEAAMRESEERFRGIFERAATGIVIRDLECRFLSCNPAFCTMIGYTEEELRGLEYATYVHPEDQEANRVECDRMAAGEISCFELVNRCIRKDGRLIWVHKYISQLSDPTGKPTNVLVLVTDITERKRRDDQIRLLMREVNHRSKNLLTVVQAIARQTAASNSADFLSRFDERVQALARSQDLLVKNEWTGVDLHELIRSQLAHFQDLIGTRLKLQGPEVFVSASAAQAIGMALHELSTNAGKYGALANGDGCVMIDWKIVSCNGKKIFEMTWCEHCAQRISSSGKRGFGSTVICEMAEMSLEAEVTFDFTATGINWRLRCRADKLLEGNATDGSEKSTSTVAIVNATGQPRVLVVEDEVLVALEIAGTLIEAGFEVVGPARTVNQALTLAKAGCDAAVLDINLGRETSEVVALALAKRNIPFIAVSGYSIEQYPQVFSSVPALTKPLRPGILVAALRKCMLDDPWDGLS